MLERVRQALLDDPVRGEVDRAGERECLAVDVQSHRKARRVDVVDERVEGLEARLGAELDAVPVAAHRAEQEAHLGQRRAAGLLDSPERVPVLDESPRELVPDGADLEHHHAHRVGDDVVELARDPRALLGDRDPCGGFSLAFREGRAHLRRLALPLREGRAHLRRLGLFGTRAQGVSGDPGDHEPEGNEDEVAGRLRAGDVDDHEDDADEHDREADSGLPGRRAGSRAGTRLPVRRRRGCRRTGSAGRRRT